MIHTYNIAGMTCNGCVTSVKNKLLQVDGVVSADVQLAAPQATVSMRGHIDIDTLQNALGNAKYTISLPGNDSTFTQVEEHPENNSYYPIFLIFGYIAGITLLLQFARGSFVLTSWMSSFMAGFFLLFSFFKLLNLKGFAEGYGSYDIVAKQVPVYGFIYPFIELALGVAYLTALDTFITNLATLIVMSVSAVGVVQSLLKKTNFQCACLGTIIKLPLSKVTLIEDLLMVAMSAFMLITNKL